MALRLIIERFGNGYRWKARCNEKGREGEGGQTHIVVAYAFAYYPLIMILALGVLARRAVDAH